MITDQHLKMKAALLGTLLLISVVSVSRQIRDNVLHAQGAPNLERISTADIVRGVRLNSNTNYYFRCPQSIDPIPIFSPDIQSNDQAYVWGYQFSGNEMVNYLLGRNGENIWDGNYFISNAYIAANESNRQYDQVQELVGGRWNMVYVSTPVRADCTRGIQTLESSGGGGSDIPPDGTIDGDGTSDADDGGGGSLDEDTTGDTTGDSGDTTEDTTTDEDHGAAPDPQCREFVYRSEQSLRGPQAQESYMMDMDGDQLLDLVQYHSGEISVYKGSATGFGDKLFEIDLNGGYGDLHFVDINRDNRMDIVAAIDVTSGDAINKRFWLVFNEGTELRKRMIYVPNFGGGVAQRVLRETILDFKWQEIARIEGWKDSALATATRNEASVPTASTEQSEHVIVTEKTFKTHGQTGYIYAAGMLTHSSLELLTETASFPFATEANSLDFSFGFGNIMELTIGDVNQDGLDDVVAGITRNYSDGTSNLYLKWWDGSPRAEGVEPQEHHLGEIIYTNTRIHEVDMGIADMDQDGGNEIVVMINEAIPDQSTYLLVDELTTAEPSVELLFERNGGGTRKINLEIVDINQDGILDIFSGGNPPQIYVGQRDCD